jgi:hypothetical protein
MVRDWVGWSGGRRVGWSDGWRVGWLEDSGDRMVGGSDGRWRTARLGGRKAEGSGRRFSI